MNVLVIAPHMDDEALGAGGTIARHVALGDRVSVCFVADRIYDHKLDQSKVEEERRCARAAQEQLGYQDAIFLGLADERLDACVQDVIIPLEQAVSTIRPDIVYLPHRGDNHQDHRAVFEAAQVVFRPAVSGVQRILCYETPSSTEQAPPDVTTAFLPTCYVDIAPYLERKLAAVACYERESRQFPHPRSPEAIRALAAWRGSRVGFHAAEAFAVVRERIQS